MDGVIDFLYIIRDNKSKILELKKNIHDRYCNLCKNNAISKEEVEKSLIDVYEANISLALTEIELIKEQKTII